MTGLPVLYRSVPSWNGLRTASIGTGAFPDAQAGLAFLQAACATLRQEGFQAVIGPMDGNTWGRYRLPVWSDGSPPFSTEPAAGPHDRAAYEAAGFWVAEEHVSATAAPGSRGWTHVVTDVTVQAWDGTDPHGLLVEGHSLVMTAFRATPFFAPMPQAAFVRAYMPLLDRADPRFILRAREKSGRVVGLTLAFPDPLRRGAVVLKTYAGLVPGAGRLMADRIHERAGEAGFAEVIHATMRRGIASEAQSRKFGGRVFRRYALLGRTL